MAKHTFVTASHTTYDETQTVEILTKAEVRKIVAEVMGLETSNIESKLKTQNRKLAKVAEQAATAAKDAADAQKQVTHLVETMRETFRDVIEELLEPHYHRLAEHLGVKIPSEAAKTKATKTKTATKKTAPSRQAKTADLKGVATPSKTKSHATTVKSRKKTAD